MAGANDTEGRLVYVVGDIHGRYDLLTDLLDRVVADAGRDPHMRRPLLGFCGDYVDRGPDSQRVIASLVWLERYAAFDCFFLVGNHEQMMLDWLEDPLAAYGWLHVGGAETLASYGVALPEPDGGREAAIMARNELTDRLPASHLAFLRRLEEQRTIGDYLVVHAGVRPGVALARQAREDLIWIRDSFLASNADHGKIVVHGHSWSSDRPERRSNRIGIDTGAYDTGVLTAVRLDGASVDFIQARAGTEERLSPPDAGAMAESSRGYGGARRAAWVG